MGTLGTKYNWMIGYSIFFGVYIFLSSMIGVSGITGQSVSANAGCGSSNIFCWIGVILSLFNLATAIGIINTVLLIPYFLFLAMIIADYIRGNG